MTRSIHENEDEGEKEKETHKKCHENKSLRQEGIQTTRMSGHRTSKVERGFEESPACAQMEFVPDCL